MRKVVRIVVVILIVLAMAALVIKRKKELNAAPAYGVRPVVVKTAGVITTNLVDSHSYLGVVEAWQTASIASRLSAKVDTVNYDEGDVVKKGDLLIQLDDQDIQAKIESSEAVISSLQTNKDFWIKEYNRDSKLAKDGVISTVSADITRNKMSDAVGKYQAAVRNLSSLKTQLDYTRLLSPYDGVVIKRNVDPGDLAVPGKVVMVVEDHSAMKIAFDAPQEDVKYLRNGMQLTAELKGKPVQLEITTVYPSLNKARVVRVEAKIAGDMGLHTGSFVPLTVVLKKYDNAVVIPSTALMQRDNDWFVFVVKDNVLHLRPVKRLMANNGITEVSGVKAGEEVVISTFLGWTNLAEGIKVEVVK